MNNTELERIAHDLITAKVARGEEVHMEWAVQELISGQPAISGDDTGFYHLCAREHTYRVVKKVVERFASETDENPRQMKMDGFDHLQAAYTVERKGERVLVPIANISAAELLARADEFDKLAEGLRAHAREIRKYVANRVDVSERAGG
jgi:hypothetical protein